MISRNRAFAMCVLAGAAILCGADASQGLTPMRPEDVQRSKMMRLAQANVVFAADLFGKVRAREGNLVFSPYSISTALTMTWAGTAGQTAEEMATALRLPGGKGEMMPKIVGGGGPIVPGGRPGGGPMYTPPAQGAAPRDPVAPVGPAPGVMPPFRPPGGPGNIRLPFMMVVKLDEVPGLYKDLQETITKAQGDDCQIANALWGQKGFAFKDDYLKCVKDDFGGVLTPLDFAKSDAATKTINDWVANQTHDKIKDLIAKGLLGRDTRLVLTNAIYFKAPWDKAFEKKATRKADFFLSADKKIQADMMNAGGELMYLKDEGVSVVEKPYKGAKAAMMLVLPDKKDGLADLEKSVTFEKINKWRMMITRTDVDLSMPKFKITAELDLNDTLKAMGMKQVFDNADFSKMADKPEGLAVSKVVHKAFIDVNEEGTEAAAATGVIVTKMAVAMPLKKVKFVADHPFLFLIRDNRTGCILFMGRMADPR